MHVKTAISPSCFCVRKQWDKTFLEQQSNRSFTLYISQVLLYQQNVCCWFRDLSCLLSTRVAVTAQQSDQLLGVLCDPQGKRSCEMLIISNNSLWFQSKVILRFHNLFQISTLRWIILNLKYQDGLPMFQTRSLPFQSWPLSAVSLDSLSTLCCFLTFWVFTWNNVMTP